MFCIPAHLFLALFVDNGFVLRSSESSSDTETESTSTSSSSDDKEADRPVSGRKTNNSTYAGKKSIQNLGIPFSSTFTAYIIFT